VPLLACPTVQFSHFLDAQIQNCASNLAADSKSHAARTLLTN
jgi:hypothetical protein